MSNSKAITIKMEVSKTVSKGGANVREKLGEVEVFLPGLAAFGDLSTVEPVRFEEDGTPVYATNELNWLASAVLGAVKTNARNKLVSGTLDLKAGNKLPENLEELVTPTDNTNTVLAERRALLALFKEWVASLDKPEAVKKLLYVFLEKPDALAVQPAAKRAQIKVYFENFGAAVEEKLTDYQGNYLLNVIAQCDEEEVDFS